MSMMQTDLPTDSQQDQNTPDEYLDELLCPTETELIQIVRSLNNKYCHSDPIPIFLFKECLDILLPWLKFIVKCSFAQGYFPNCLKEAIVQPVHKGHGLDTDHLSSYRPVSNLTYLSKILEKCYLDKLLNHLDVNKLLGHYQSAYRKYHSCDTALLKVHDDIIMILTAPSLQLESHYIIVSNQLY